MGSHIRAISVLLIATLVVCSVLYPLTILGIGQILVPRLAEGQIVNNKAGESIGSRLIAQEFKNPKWFWPRPSGVGYNGAGSGGSNLAPSNPALRERVISRLGDVGAREAKPAPADLVTASGSGLDPHLTLASARYQMDRIGRAWANELKTEPERLHGRIEDLLQKQAFHPLGGLVGGESLVNVLEVNLLLEDALRRN